MAKRRSGILAFSVVVAGALFVGSCASPSEISEDATEMVQENTAEDIETVGFCGVEISDQVLETIAIGATIGLLTDAYIAWGEQEGCFAKHGLIPDVSSGGATENIAGLIGGSLDVVSSNVLRIAVARGNSDVDLLVLSGHYEVSAEQLAKAKASPTLDNGALILETALIVSPDWPYNSLEDLRGAKIAAGSNVSAPGLGLQRALQEVGLGSSDVELLPLTSAEGLQALLAGEVDAASLTGIRAFQAMEQGGKLALYPGAYFYEPGVVVSWFTTGEVVAQKKEQLLAFKEAMMEIYAALQDPLAQASFLALLETQFDFDQVAISRFSFPPLMTREVTHGELQYISDLLWAEGLIDKNVQFAESVIVK